MATTLRCATSLPTYTLPTSVFSMWVARGLNDLHGSEPTEAPKKRGRGRPKGSPNKTKATPTEEVLVEKRPRGRPKGSKNKTKATPTDEVLVEKRPRGRPKGSKNKTTKEPKEVLTPKKRGRQSGTKDSHTRKSKKSIHAANTIQSWWRSIQ